MNALDTRVRMTHHPITWTIYQMKIMMVAISMIRTMMTMSKRQLVITELVMEAAVKLDKT